MKIKLIRPNGKQWTVSNYIKRITQGQNIDLWKKEHGESWKSAFSDWLITSVKQVLDKQYVEVTE